MDLQERYAEAVEQGLEGLEFVSFGPCPGCPECMDDYGYDSIEEFNADLENGQVCEGDHFSPGACDICGDPMGGQRWVYHWVDKGGAVMHESDGCDNCMFYVCNGDLPEDEYIDWLN